MKPFTPAIPTWCRRGRGCGGCVLVEHDTPASSSTARNSSGAVDVPVVVAEHGQDRHADVADRVGDDLRLLGLAVRGQVAGEQDHVDAVLERGEGGVRALAVVGALAVVDVARGGDPDPALVTALGGPPVDGDGRAHIHSGYPIRRAG